jgi:hypothetical protein
VSTPASEPGTVERLWTGADGAICLLSTCEEPPMYVVSLVRGTEVLRECRLYGRATAEMLAEGWCESTGSKP